MTKYRRCQQLVLLLCVAIDASAIEIERVIDLPEGGRLFYDWRQPDDAQKLEIIGIKYSGTPEWLVSQGDPRSQWHSLSSLKEVVLTHTTVTREEAKYIASLQTVIDLEITDTVFNRGALEPLSKMKGLKSLSLEFASHGSSNSAHKAEIDDKFFAFLDGLTELEALTLSTKVEEETFNRISRLRQLSWLSLAGLADVSADSASAISGLDQLENLLIHSIEDPTPLLNGLVDHRQLNQLWLETTKLDNLNLKSIATIKPLEQIYLRVSKIGSLSPFAELTNLRELRIISVEYAKCDGFRFLENLPKLEILILAGGALPDFSIDYLRGHKQIRELVISDQLDLDAISSLESLPNLKNVRTHNKIDSDWYREASKRLPEVEIFGVDK